VKADEGISVTLRCELSKAGIAAEWMKGDDLLKNGIKHQIRRRETTQEMLLWRPGPGDSGVYSCVCAGQKTSATVTIVGEEEGEVMLIALNGGRPYHNGSRFHGSTKADNKSNACHLVLWYYAYSAIVFISRLYVCTYLNYLNMGQLVK